MIEPSGLASGRVTGRLLLTFLELSESLLLHQVGTVGQGLLPSHLSHGEARLGQEEDYQTNVPV